MKATSDLGNDETLWPWPPSKQALCVVTGRVRRKLSKGQVTQWKPRNNTSDLVEPVELVDRLMSS